MQQLRLSTQTNRQIKLTGRQHTQGIALLEILIAVVVLSVGLLGLAGIQMLGTKGTQNAHSKYQASMLTQAMLEKIRANPEGDYEQLIQCDIPLVDDCGVSACTADELAFYDLYTTQCGTVIGGNRVGGLTNLLLNGTMSISCPPPAGDCSDHRINILTQWDERAVDRNDNMQANGFMQKSIQMTTSYRSD
jgi:type IV pilus assembly protein PilV